ncbi:hypothetical protein RPD_1010 [Rhodopseudomonas palustris BisB5]|uniref:Uncharacterized protein n=1 Tax=Rhodopseudomonas palustris (strain BisB5) TaxID=316057 RepID=Q13CE1_RHOPS|nr:hypothetical protein RPD_1010 [Rhodopseudomonas palustris BisB5]
MGRRSRRGRDGDLTSINDLHIIKPRGSPLSISRDVGFRCHDECARDGRHHVVVAIADRGTRAPREPSNDAGQPSFKALTLPVRRFGVQYPMPSIRTKSRRHQLPQRASPLSTRRTFRGAVATLVRLAGAADAFAVEAEAPAVPAGVVALGAELADTGSDFAGASLLPVAVLAASVFDVATPCASVPRLTGAAIVSLLATAPCVAETCVTASAAMKPAAVMVRRVRCRE